MISCSNCIRQTPHHWKSSICLVFLVWAARIWEGSGKGLGRHRSESVPLRTTWVPEPERLRPGRCKQPRAGRGWFPVEQSRAWAVWAGKLTCAVSRGRPSVAEALQAHASLIYLQRPSLPTARLNKWALKKKKKKVSTTAPFVSGRKSDTEETSKQKKL